MTSFDVSMLKGVVVVHEAKGVGRVTKVEDNRVTISLGIHFPLNKERPRSIAYWIWDYLTDPNIAINWGVPIDAFLDKEDFGLAPDKKEFRRIERVIKTEKSNNVIIHTNNPASPAEVKKRMVKDEIKALKSSVLWYDDKFIKTYRQLVDVLDWQLSYTLLRGNESLDAYKIRLDIIEDSIGSTAWSEHIYNHVLPVAEISVDRSVECLAAITGYYMYEDEMTPREAIQASIKLAEDRMRMHLSIIQGFNRNRAR